MAAAIRLTLELAHLRPERVGITGPLPHRVMAEHAEKSQVGLEARVSFTLFFSQDALARGHANIGSFRERRLALSI